MLNESSCLTREDLLDPIGGKIKCFADDKRLGLRRISEKWKLAARSAIAEQPSTGPL